MKMNKKLVVWVVGGLITAAVFGAGAINSTIVSAADKTSQTCDVAAGQKGMMGSLDAKEMQKQCLEMLKDPEMQKAMKDVMKTPEMQAMMKQMLQQDMGFHQMMSDLVNSVDMSSEHGDSQPDEQAPANSASAHSGHHG